MSERPISERELLEVFAATYFALLRTLTQAQRERFVEDLAEQARQEANGHQPETARLLGRLADVAGLARKHLTEH